MKQLLTICLILVFGSCVGQDSACIRRMDSVYHNTFIAGPDPCLKYNCCSCYRELDTIGSYNYCCVGQDTIYVGDPRIDTKIFYPSVHGDTVYYKWLGRDSIMLYGKDMDTETLTNPVKYKPDTVKWKPYYPKLSKKKAHTRVGNVKDTMYCIHIWGEVNSWDNIGGFIDSLPDNSQTQILYGVYIDSDFKVVSLH